MIAVVAVALAGLLCVLTLLEAWDHDTAIGWAERPETIERIQRLRPVLENIAPAQIDNLLDITSRCHSGFTVTTEPFRQSRVTSATRALQARLAARIGLEPDDVRVGYTRLTRNDFSYRKCRHSEIDLPIEGIVISVRLQTGPGRDRWFNTEVHPHEWHVRDKIDWLARSGAAFLLIGGIAIFFMRRLGQPLRRLTEAAVRFGGGLNVVAVEERGPPDLRRAIGAFNAMQRQVTNEIERRTQTLAAISHDVRTPLTALRIKAELVPDESTRRDLIANIDRMEAMTASALAYLRGESRAEAIREIDLSALIESECDDFEQMGHEVRFVGQASFRYPCRSEALARAVRNLIDNAVKYAKSAEVNLRVDSGSVDIVVADGGPGIADEDLTRVLEPFERLSQRTNSTHGFGLGLSVVKAISEGHGGALMLAANRPQGLVATIRLPPPEVARSESSP